MATINTYDKCCAYLAEHPLYSLSSSGNSERIYKPDLDFLFGGGECLLLDESELNGCCESEKRRHLQQDAVMLSVYIEQHPHRKYSVESSKVIQPDANI